MSPSPTIPRLAGVSRLRKNVPRTGAGISEGYRLLSRRFGEQCGTRLPSSWASLLWLASALVECVTQDRSL